MSGSSSVTLVRTEESTIDFRVTWRDAARVMVADLAPDDASTVRVKLTEFPKSDTVALNITTASAVDGCTLTYINQYFVRLSIPIAFWFANTSSRYTLEMWLETANDVQSVGNILVTLIG